MLNYYLPKFTTMKKVSLSLLIVLVSAVVAAQPSANHYTELNNKSGATLVTAISTCAAKGYHSLGYDGLYSAYEQTDARANGKVWDMYSNCTFSFSNKGGNSSECAGWNREHTVPQSWWGKGTSNQGCDIFQVIPTDAYVNNRRSNHPYGEVNNATWTSQNGSKVGSSSISGYSGTVFEPIDEYKGDLARGILGAMIKWKGNWTQSEGNSTFSGVYDDSHNYGLTQYGINVFLKWHRQDPVSQKELDRNNAIERTQGNRNPFIDYPELVEYLWGNKKNQSVSLASLVSAYDGYTPDTTTTNPVDTTHTTPVDTTATPVIISGDGEYVKVTSNLNDWSGVYLIVSEADNVCLDGSDASKLSSSNTKSVTIASAKIASDNVVDAAAFIVSPAESGYYIKSRSGYYIGHTGSKNSLDSSTSPDFVNTIAVNNGVAAIGCDGRMMRYNSSAHMFRYYSTGQGDIVLYRKTATATSLDNNADNGYTLLTFGQDIIMQSEQPAQIAVYDRLGRMIILRADVTSFSCTLPQGLYIIIVNGNAEKVLVR